MAVSVIAPANRVTDANGLPYVNAYQYVYNAGTTTLRPIYTDDGLSIAADNPQRSNANGEFPRVFTAPGTYKLRRETSANVLIGSEMDDIDTGLSGDTVALPIAQGGTGATTAAAARANLDVPSNSELTDLSDQISAVVSSITNIVSVPQGRLTPTSAVPVIATGVTAGTAIYYTPYIGNICPIYDGVQFNPETFAELTLTLASQHTLSSHFDCFIIDDGGTIRIVTGPAWSTITAGNGARGSGAGTTELTKLNGIYVNANAMATAWNGSSTYSVAANRGTYVGSIFIDGTAGQISCLLAYGTSRKWSVWNAYNRRPIILKAGPSTASWTPAASASGILAANNAAANSLTTFCGLPEEIITLISNRKALVGTSSGTGSATAVSTGIGVNSTTAYSGQNADLVLSGSTGGGVDNAVTAMMMAHHTLAPGIGINTITACEASVTNGATRTMYGTEASFLLKAEWAG